MIFIITKAYLFHGKLGSIMDLTRNAWRRLNIVAPLTEHCLEAKRTRRSSKFIPHVTSQLASNTSLPSKLCGSAVLAVQSSTSGSFIPFRFRWSRFWQFRMPRIIMLHITFW